MSTPTWSPLPKVRKPLAEIPIMSNRLIAQINPYASHNIPQIADRRTVTMVKHQADHDAENRFELFLLDDDQKKVESKDETRIPNTAIFTFNKEDHTLGNLLASRLHKYDYVLFSAYKVPHPLFASFDLRVQTDGTVTPKEAIVRACKDVVAELDVLSRSFTTEWLGKRIVHEGEAERLAREREM